MPAGSWCSQRPWSSKPRLSSRCGCRTRQHSFRLPACGFRFSVFTGSNYTTTATQIDRTREPRELLPRIQRLFDVSAGKILSIEETWKPEHGAPVFTVNGRYQARGWTEWTQGFQFGAAILQFDASSDESFLDLGRSRTHERMAPHLTHMGVHDHGFNNVSTCGNLWRLARERRFEASEWEVRYYELALKASGAVQARRW